MRGLITNQTATVPSQILDKITIKESPDGTEEKDTTKDNSTQGSRKVIIVNKAAQATNTVSKHNTKNPVEEGIKHIIINDHTFM